MMILYSLNKNKIIPMIGWLEIKRKITINTPHVFHLLIQDITGETTTLKFLTFSEEFSGGGAEKSLTVWEEHPHDFCSRGEIT